MNRGSGMNHRDERSRGMETLVDESLAKIKPTDPLRFTRKVVG